ncbi:hypothetical protein [Lysobacter sp. Root604]|uniref:hypothetical protein n=1 Tax=Lysobacter sp. Root604 TaxID=1736568 RepID=UPI0012FA68C4|nr:hypothetical protein [Lysobacter sp. Root604]
MIKSILFVACLATSTVGCVREPEVSVATNLKKNLTYSNGDATFDIDKEVVEARKSSGFEVIAFVTAHDKTGTLKCTPIEEAEARTSVWLDPLKNPWVKLHDRAKISYARAGGELIVAIDDLKISRCEIGVRLDTWLHVHFDALPKPWHWSGDGMFGLDVSLPNE